MTGKSKSVKEKQQAACVKWVSAYAPELRAEATLPAKFERLLKSYPLDEMFKDKRIAIKMHIGSNLGYTTIHPVFVRILVNNIKEAGGKPFITDGIFDSNQPVMRGYTEQVLGCPVYPAAGIANKHYYQKEINYRGLTTLEICGNIAEAEAMIVFSHGKGHGHSGFGGALKNIAMGCVSGNSRGMIHRLMAAEFKWDQEKCTHCYLCRDNCPSGAINFNPEGKMELNDHHCHYCMHCTESCTEQAITIDQSGYGYFQQGMALATKAVLDYFDPAHLFYINVMMNITPLCDCWGFTTLPFVPDIGIVAGTDIVATECASIDMIKSENLIPGTLPKCYKPNGKGHLLEQIHPGKDPYLQTEKAEKLGLGTRNYQLQEIE